MSGGGRPHSATNVIASILRQICLSFTIVPRRLKQLYGQSDREANIHLELDDVLEALRETSRNVDQPIFIVVDGLDDCNMREPKDFTKFFTGLKETSWKSLITSRFDQDIMSKVCKACSKDSIKDENVENDIRYFMDLALKGNEPVDNLLGVQTLRVEIIETLTSKAHGM